MGKGWDAIRKKVLKRDRHVCQLQLAGCEGKASTVDHILPRSAGGDNSLENLQAACYRCNGKKGSAIW